MNDVVDQQILYKEGIELIEDGQFEKALEIGKRLERIRWTGGFELQAIAFENMDRLEDAIKILQRGIEAAGGPYFLFSRMGNYLSDMERYDEALEAYDKGLALSETDELLFKLNRGIVFWRKDNSKQALNEMAAYEAEANNRGVDEAIYWHFKAQLADVLKDLERAAEYKKTVAELEPHIFDDDEFSSEKARICAAYAQYLWDQKSLEETERWLGRAIELDPANTVAHWVVREKNKRLIPEGGIYFRMIIEGIWPASLSGDGIEYGFFTTVDCVAETSEQALALARPFFPKEVQKSLVAEEVEILEQDAEQPKGLYKFSGYNLFNPDIDDEDDD